MEATVLKIDYLRELQSLMESDALNPDGAAEMLNREGL